MICKNRKIKLIRCHYRSVHARKAGCRIPNHFEVAIDKGHVARSILGLVFYKSSTHSLMKNAIDKTSSLKS